MTTKPSTKHWLQSGILCAVCALVIGVYGYTARTGFLDVASRNGGADTPYNLLVQGFRSGQLHLKRDVPRGFQQLADPYDPVANQHYRNVPYRLHDLSYYNGRLYMYFGPTPALVLFWPYAALTGHYLSQTTAVVVFCTLGFLVGVGLLWSFWRRYFPNIGFGVVIGCVLALGWTTGVLIMMARSEVYEVAISCGYFLTMLTLAVLWRAIHEPVRCGRWLALASLVYGLAVAARPNLLFGAVILLLPLIHIGRERRSLVALFFSAIGPIFLIGLGLMLYNYRRFDSPLEFGMRYQLAGSFAIDQQVFRLRSFWPNFRAYFLEPAYWNFQFPFAHVDPELHFPNGQLPAEVPFGILTSIPLVWLVLAVPLAWRGQPTETKRPLVGFLAMVIVYFAATTVVVILFNSANIRYTTDFLPALVLLAVVGILGLEQVLAGRPIWRNVTRWGWIGLLVYSLATNVLVSIEQSTRTDIQSARSENEVGIALARMGRFKEAIGFFEQAIRCEPRLAEAHNNLGLALLQENRLPEAQKQCEESLRLDPGNARAHNSLGLVFMRMGKYPEAIGQYRETLRLQPDHAEAQTNLTRLQSALQ